MGIHDGHRENMRKRFLENDLNGFASHEVLELLLYYAIPRRDTNKIAHNLVDRFGSLNEVLTTPLELLTQVDGIGETSAILIRLVALAAQKARLEVEECDLFFTNRGRMETYILDLFSQERTEVLYQLCLDKKGKLLTRRCIRRGGASAVDLDVRKLVENALLSGASYVILAHNHPSGIAQPSPEDIEATNRARAALEAVSVRLEDHYIVAGNNFVSFAKSGYLV